MTGRQLAERRLRESEARYRAIVESLVEMVCRFEPNGRILFANAAYAKARGTTADALEGADFWTFVDEADRTEVRALLDRLTPEHPEVRIENRFETTEGVRWTMWTNRALAFDDEGRALEIQSSGIDITDRKLREVERARAEQSLRDSEARLREASRLKDDFLATLSHELRTPLNAVLGWAQMLRSRSLPLDRADRALEALERNALAQVQLVDDLLDMSRISAGKLQMTFVDVDLPAVLLAAIETIRASAAGRRLELSIEIPPDQRVIVPGDGDRLKQVLWNLLSNAVKFTEPDGTIAVRLDRNGHHAEISIVDDGEGIDPAFLPYVFERFRQGDSTTTRRHGGLGLGLAIAKHIVEAHDGTIAAESAGRGAGARFRVRLPSTSTSTSTST